MTYDLKSNYIQKKRESKPLDRMNLNITYYIVGDVEVSSWSKADFAIIEPEEPCQNMNEAAMFGMMAADHIRKMRKVADVQHPDGACYYLSVYKAR